MIIDNINVWSDFVLKIGLTGIARQLAVQMTPLSFQNGVLTLRLDSRYENLRSQSRLQEVSDALQQGCGQTFKVEVETGEVEPAQTAAGVLADRQRTDLEKTRRDFKEDELVNEFVSQFDAEVDESSIKPVN